MEEVNPGVKVSRSRRQRTLLTVLGVSALVHVLALVVFGGFVIYRFVVSDKPEFEAPQLSEAIEPPPPRYDVQIQENTESAPRPPQPALQVTAIADMATPDFQLEMPEMVAVSNVGGQGQGGGLGAGLGGAGLNMGKSAVNFFGMDTEAEKIVLVIDMGKSMVEVERGDLPGFERVKQEFARVIQGLSPATLFNVVAFEAGILTFQNRLVSANNRQKQAAIEFLEPFYKFQGAKITGRAGIPRGASNYTPDYSVAGYSNPVGSSRLDAALLAAFEMGADAIFVITDGTPRIFRDRTEEEHEDYLEAREEYEERLEDWRRNWSSKDQQAFEKRRQRIKQEREAERKRRAEQGLPPRQIEVVPPIRERGKPWPPRKRWLIRNDEFIERMEESAEKIYEEQRGQEMPSLYLIGYSASEKAANFLEDLERAFPRSDFDNIGAFEPEEDD